MSSWTPEETQHVNLIQSTIALMAIEALIATHPHPEKVRAVFDQMFGQFQAGVLTTGAADPNALAVARQTVEKLFGSP